jgi:hypothetical protein
LRAPWTLALGCATGLAAFATAQSNAQSIDTVSSTTSPVARATAQPAFSDYTNASGISFFHADTADIMAGGVCFFDYDKDGWQDLLATNRNGKTNQLFRNNGNGTFSDVTAAAGLTTITGSMGAYAADFDNNGWQDLLVLMSGRLTLYRNNGDATFTDVTDQSGMQSFAWNTAAALADFDRDGLLDVYVGCYVSDGFYPYFDGSPNKLFRNVGNLQFVDVTAQAGVDTFATFTDPRGFVRSTYACTLSTLAYDYDRDGWPDIFVGNDFGPYVIPNLLYRNNRDGTFSEVGSAVGFHIAEFNMGLAAGDVNGDLIPDIYTTNLGDNHLLLNDGRGRLTDIAQQWNASEGSLNGTRLTSWACIFFDLDLDGYRDLYVSNGWINAQLLPNEMLAPSRPLQNFGRTMQIVPESQFPWDRGVGRGAAAADIDNDGDEDIVQLNNKQQLKVYRNDEVSANNRAILELQGTLSNRDGVGAWLTIRSKQFTQAIDYLRGGSYGSQSAAPIIAGLSTDPIVDELNVTWPSSGVLNRRLAIPANQPQRIVEPTVTIQSLGNLIPIGSFTQVPVTIVNHAATPQSVTFSAGASAGSARIQGPAYHYPITVGANATVTVPVYLDLPSSAWPLAKQFGIWLQIYAHSGPAGGQDDSEMPF